MNIAEFSQWLKTPAGFDFCLKLYIVEAAIDVPIFIFSVLIPSSIASLNLWILVLICVPIFVTAVRAGFASAALLSYSSDSGAAHKNWLFSYSCILLGWYIIGLCMFRRVRSATQGSFPYIVAFINIGLGGLSTVAFKKNELPARQPDECLESADAKDYEHQLCELTSRVFTVKTHGDQPGDSIETPCDLGQCVICLAEYYPGDVACELHCQHFYHSACFQDWIRNGGRSCPLRCSPKESTKLITANMAQIPAGPSV
jgi:hypothetical protein